MAKTDVKPEIKIPRKVLSNFLSTRLAYNEAKEKKEEAKVELDRAVWDFIKKDTWPIPPKTFRAKGKNENLIISVVSTYRPLKEEKLTEAKKNVEFSSLLWAKVKRFFKKHFTVSFTIPASEVSDFDSFESELRALLAKWNLDDYLTEKSVETVFEVDPRLHQERFAKLDPEENVELDKIATLEIRGKVEAKDTGTRP